MRVKSPIFEREFIALMATLMAMVAFTIDSILPALSAIAYDMDVVQGNQRQFVLVIVFLGINIGTFMFGPLSDAIGRKIPILIGGGLFTMGSVIAIFTPTFDLLLLARFLQGFGISTMQVMSIAVIRDQYKGDAMARISSFAMTAFIIAPCIAPLIGQVIVSNGSWRFIFVFLLSMGVFSTTWFWVRQPETLPPAKRIQFSTTAFLSGIFEVITHRTVIPYAIASGLLFGAFMGYLVSSQQIFQDMYGVGALFPVYFALLALSFGGATFINGKLVLKFGMRTLCHHGLCSVWIISVCVLLTLYIIDISVLPLPVLLAILCLYFFFEGLSFSNLNAIAMEPMGHIAGIATSIIGFIRGAVGIATGYFIGTAFDQTVLPLFIGLFICPTLCILLAMWSNKKINILK